MMMHKGDWERRKPGSVVRIGDGPEYTHAALQRQETVIAPLPANKR
jgi:hypothetical protein